MKERKELINAVIYFLLAICFFIGAKTGFRGITQTNGLIFGSIFVLIGVFWILRHFNKK